MPISSQFKQFYSFSHKTVNAKENFWNVYCFATNQTQDKTAKDNRQTAAGVSHELIQNNELAVYLLQEVFNIPFGSLWKSYFLTTSQHQSLDSVCSKTKLPNIPKSECKLWKFTTVQVGVLGEGFLQCSYKKIWIENHQSQLTSMTFWTVRETNTEKHRLWLAHFFLFLDALSSCVWSCLLD